MILPVARFELRYVLRNPLLWATAVVAFAIFFAAMTVEGFGLGAEGGLLKNGAYATLRNYLAVSILSMFVTTAFVAGAVTRDDETGFTSVMRSTAITKGDYLFGRFLGAFAAAALVLLVVPLASWLGALAPSADAAALGPQRPWDHLYGYVVVALPNVFVTSALLFSLATATRSMMGAYLGVVGLVAGYFLVDAAFGGRPDLVTTVALADPFGARPLSDAVRYWTVAERNTALPEICGTLLTNRLLWLGIAGAFLWLAYANYSFSERGPAGRGRWREGPTDGQPSDEVGRPPRARPPRRGFGPGATRAMLRMRTRFEVRQVVASPAFVVLTAFGLFTTLITLVTQRDPDGRPTIPTTLSMIPELEDGLGLLPAIIAIFYAGELVWRERTRRMHVLVDTTPMPNWVYVVSKTFAMALVLLAVLLASVVASVGLQLSYGYTDLEVSKYLLWYVLPTAWDLLLVAALAIFVQAVSPHKAVGWGIMVLFLLWQQAATGIDHTLLNFGSAPPMLTSDMNGAGSFWKGAWVLRIYWGAFATLLLVGAHVLWRRGTETSLRPRIARAREGLVGAPGWIASLATSVFLASGAFAYYNTNVLNDYRSQAQTQRHAAELERAYGRYVGLPQPTITAMVVDVDLYPEDRRAITSGRFTLTNETDGPISDVHVRLLVDPDLELTSATLTGAALVHDDAKFAYRIYRLHRPMRPGEERVLTFGTRLEARGFRNGWPNTRLVENGTFLSEIQLAPLVGTSQFGFIQDPATRRAHGLPDLRPAPALEDTSATARPDFGRGWASSDVTVSTAADQTPLAPGDRVSDVTHGGRRTARFLTSAPVRSRFTILSARYAERRRDHGGVDLAVYYHPAHAWNVDRMLEAMAASLDYYQANFGPYPFDHARIAEFPGYHSLAQAFAGTIGFSETAGFISDYRAPETLDYVAHVTAHELAHQYWAHQVVGADMEGQDVLSETLAQYSAYMVGKVLRGESQLRRYLRFELDRYLEGRAHTSIPEPPLVRVTGQQYLAYRKGGLAMYLLQQRLGEEAVNRALRTLLERFRFRGAPYPRSIDLVEALRAEADSDEDRDLITDLFERVTLYELKVDQPTAVQRADGRWEVTVPIEASKRYADGQGNETEATLDERIEVGLFTAEPGRDAFGASDVIFLERMPIHSGNQALTFITERRPTHAGVDPYNTYIDRTPSDNVSAVE